MRKLCNSDATSSIERILATIPRKTKQLVDKVRLGQSLQQRHPGPSEPEKWSGQGATGEDSTHVRRAQATQPWPFSQARD